MKASGSQRREKKSAIDTNKDLYSLAKVLSCCFLCWTYVAHTIQQSNIPPVSWRRCVGDSTDVEDGELGDRRKICVKNWSGSGRDGAKFRADICLLTQSAGRDSESCRPLKEQAGIAEAEEDDGAGLRWKTSLSQAARGRSSSQAGCPCRGEAGEGSRWPCLLSPLNLVGLLCRIQPANTLLNHRGRSCATTGLTRKTAC